MSNKESIMENAKNVLSSSFGFNTFRGVQEQVIQRLLVDNKSALCIMPTGGGKSITYQLPALILPGLTIVISPLLTLQKDQVDHLKVLELPAAELNSTCSAEDLNTIRKALKARTLKLLYIAPERLSNENFIAQMEEYRESGGVISLVAIDEVHCVSSWGYSFRPIYITVSRFVKELGAERVVCLTATATVATITDIAKEFGIDTKEGVFKNGVYRSNLAITISPCRTINEKLEKLVPFLKSRTSGAAIVYVTTQKDSEIVADSLKDEGIECKYYHAGLSNTERKATQEWFMEGEDVIVATIAFGLGIDKQNVSQVVHFMMPKSMVNYGQEVGRCGRNGLPGECLMLPADFDLPILESFVRGGTPTRSSVRNWLKEVFEKEPDPDGTLTFNSYEQTRNFDIKDGTIALLNVLLELNFGYIKAATPYYSMYTIKPREVNPETFSNITKDRSLAAVALKSHWKFGRIWYTIDILAIAQASGVPRKDLARQISRWESAGYCEVKASQSRACFISTETPPTEEEEINTIADSLYDIILQREKREYKGLTDFIDYINKPECYAQGLAEYFEGEQTSVPNNACGKCSWCLTKKSHNFQFGKPTPYQESDIERILSICGIRDNSNLLARLAFGITSPRLTQHGLSTNPIFGICGMCSFTELEARFEEVCVAEGRRNKAILAPPKTPRTQTTPSTPKSNWNGHSNKRAYSGGFQASPGSPSKKPRN